MISKFSLYVSFFKSKFNFVRTRGFAFAFIKYFVCPFLVIFPLLVEAASFEKDDMRIKDSDRFSVAVKSDAEFIDIKNNVGIKGSPKVSSSTSKHNISLNGKSTKNTNKSRHNNKRADRSANKKVIEKIQYIFLGLFLVFIPMLPVFLNNKNITPK